jgi:predicted dehydrogenase
LLEDKNVDAVVVATPDHWHALQTMMACAAGKDVYCEKPLTLFVREGRWMIDVARRFKRVVQVGTQQRSGPHYRRARELLRAGRIGDIVSVQVNIFATSRLVLAIRRTARRRKTSITTCGSAPAPQRPYNPNRALYHFRWFWNYSGGQMTNLGHHSLDIVHWVTAVKGPRAVTCAGGRYFLKDNCEVPDLQDAIIEYPAPDWSAAVSQTSHSADRTAERADNSKAPANICRCCGWCGSTQPALRSDHGAVPRMRGRRDEYVGARPDCTFKAPKAR